MEKVVIELSFEADKLEALEYCLQKERTNAKKMMADALQQLYEEKVPEAVREYLERKNPPAAKPRRPRPQKETKKEEQNGKIIIYIGICYRGTSG